MGIEEKDFLLRQLRQLAEGLGAILGKESLKELIRYDQSTSEKLSDEEIDLILLIVLVKEKANDLKLSEVKLAESLAMELTAWQEIDQGTRLPSVGEYQQLKKFSEEK